MQTISSSIWEGVRNAFGDPASIRRVLATHPRMRASLRAPARTISARNVPSWHELGTPAGRGSKYERQASEQIRPPPASKAAWNRLFTREIARA